MRCVEGAAELLRLLGGYRLRPCSSCKIFSERIALALVPRTGGRTCSQNRAVEEVAGHLGLARTMFSVDALQSSGRQGCQAGEGSYSGMVGASWCPLGASSSVRRVSSRSNSSIAGGDRLGSSGCIAMHFCLQE